MILHLVTDSQSLAPGATSRQQLQCLLEQLSYAVAAGVDVVQIRERRLEAGELSALVSAAVGRARPYGIKVVVNDRLDVAIAAGADGVHLREDSIAAHDVRRLVPPGFIVGRSVHGIPPAPDIEGVDYLIAGTVWPSASKTAGHPLLGIDGVRAIVEAVSIPVLAIGGVTPERIVAVAASGAAGVAGIGLFRSEGDGCRAIDLIDRVAKVRRTFDTLRSAS